MTRKNKEIKNTEKKDVTQEIQIDDEITEHNYIG
jgi:hypothetical protein